MFSKPYFIASHHNCNAANWFKTADLDSKRDEE